MNTHNQTIRTQLHNESYDLADLLMKNRFVQAVTDGVSRYPIHRELRFAAKMELEVLFDAIALSGHWTAQRLDANNLILDGADVFISGRGGRKQDYCSAYFDIWGETPAAAENAKALLLALVGDKRITEPMFAIDWHFLTSRGELQNVHIEEKANDVLHDLAYPELKDGVAAFIDRFLNADETVLVLQGPPGTGKTRLIRAILGAISRRKGEDARALYTGDKKAVESDEIFVRFITGWEDAFVIEDADHMLKPRCDGNEHLHRFLTIADGVVRSQGRKIIFSTNLPNVGDLDEALIRPGRCFARVFVRELTPAEAEALIAYLVADRPSRAAAVARLMSASRKSYALADIYSVVKAITLDGAPRLAA
ncbi:MAG: AAA family ATPase [Betaproteobacteria bacterium]|nr:AAA family ATPase [Betaproteobacteria bacterium]